MTPGDMVVVKYNPEVHHQRSIRLRGYDYSLAGAYFVTVCTYERECIFEDPKLKATVEQIWHAIAAAGGCFVDEFVVMPNHVHGIIWIVGAKQQHREVQRKSGLSSGTSAIIEAGGGVAAPLRHVVPGSLGALVRAFKSAAAKRINNLRGTPGGRVWQRNYYERIIRDDAELNAVRQYIRDNPLKWAGDPDNPENV